MPALTIEVYKRKGPCFACGCPVYLTTVVESGTVTRAVISCPCGDGERDPSVFTDPLTLGFTHLSTHEE